MRNGLADHVAESHLVKRMSMVGAERRWSQRADHFTRPDSRHAIRTNVNPGTGSRCRSRLNSSSRPAFSEIYMVTHVNPESADSCCSAGDAPACDQRTPQCDSLQSQASRSKTKEAWIEFRTVLRTVDAVTSLYFRYFGSSCCWKYPGGLKVVLSPAELRAYSCCKCILPQDFFSHLTSTAPCRDPYSHPFGQKTLDKLRLSLTALVAVVRIAHRHVHVRMA